MEGNNKVYSDILKSVFTTEEASALVDAAENTIAALFHNAVNIEELIKTMFDDSIANRILELLKTNNIVSIDSLKDFLNGLQKVVTDGKIMNVTIAVIPNHAIITLIGSWVRDQFPDQPIFLKLEYDPAIISGVIVTFEGKYVNKSLRKEIDAWFEAKRGA
jgi:F0F1-type ATP synthase delta subunit